MIESLHPREDVQFFLKLLQQNKQAQWIVGLDEAGAGCLSGPLFAAAYAMSVNPALEELEFACVVHDSKKLSQKQREESFAFLHAQQKDCGEHHKFLVKEVSIQTIEDRNIYWARMGAFEELIEDFNEQLSGEIIFIVDGPRLHRSSDSDNFPEQVFAYPQADGRFFAVAAAAILAKVSRDRHMIGLGRDFPHYAWHKNKGYATADHRDAIKQWGTCAHHRPSFCGKILRAEGATLSRPSRTDIAPAAMWTTKKTTSQTKSEDPSMGESPKAGKPKT